MESSNKKNGSVRRSGGKVAVGVGLAALAAAVAGAYFLYGAKGAARRRKQVKAWSLKARGEVLEQLEKLSGMVNEKTYHTIVHAVANKYKKVKHLAPREVAEFAGELKSHWKDIAKEMRASTKHKKAQK